ncbi:exosporium protein C [Paenibacillus rhizovicinus]|uniref:Exosporium protein C n=1 Tax=Paenibacillus rhizovicinus TaxID=2704463 RepID=A0A6C0NTG3_9BACL|nr:exosporium protein C [Paenibacillus rhizovicinus]QHW29401.1 exosporium protein C [Paenibacillus rhizovicinus]
MAQLIDYNVSVPAVATNQVAITVPITPNKIILAQLGIFVLPQFANNNRVQLVATFGAQAVETTVDNTPPLLFRVFRDTQEIYYGVQGTESGFEHFYMVTFQVIDINVSSGAHSYSFFVENLESNTVAQIIGPMNVSAAVYAV